MDHISYKDVEKAHGKEGAREVYKQIAKIAGGDPSPFHEGGMDVSQLSDSDKKKIDKLMAVEKSEAAEDKKKIVYSREALIAVGKAEGKSRLVQIAGEVGASVVPDSDTKIVIVEKILAAQERNK